MYPETVVESKDKVGIIQDEPVSFFLYCQKQGTVKKEKKKKKIGGMWKEHMGLSEGQSGQSWLRQFVQQNR